MKKILLIITLAFILFVYTDAQSFDIYKGDTINTLDENNHKTGHWISFKRGTEQILHEGNYLNGKKDGVWISYYSEGQRKSEITYLHGKKEGFAKVYFENGNIAEEGSWSGNKWVGKYKSYYTNGKLSYSWVYNEKGNRSGYQQYYYDNGNLKIEGEWVDGKEKGVIREYYSSGGLKSERSFSEGKIDSSKIVHYEISEHVRIAPDTNIVIDSNITDHIKPDTVKVFHGNGEHKFYNKYKKIEKDGMFKNGLLISGKHFIYDDDGNLVKTMIYKDGKVIEVKLENN